jgi:hypothetical protein
MRARTRSHALFKPAFERPGLGGLVRTPFFFAFLEGVGIQTIRGAILRIRVLANHYFCIVYLLSIVTNRMPEVASDLLAPHTSGPRDVPRVGL